MSKKVWKKTESWFLFPDHTSPFVPTPPPAITLQCLPELSDAQMEMDTGHHWYGVETPFEFGAVPGYGQPNDTAEPKVFRLDGALPEDVTNFPVIALANAHGETVLEIMMVTANSTIVLSSSVDDVRRILFALLFNYLLCARLIFFCQDPTTVSYPTKLDPGEPFSLSVHYDAEAQMFVVVLEDDFGPMEFELDSEEEQVITSTRLDGDMEVTFAGYVEEGQSSRVWKKYFPSFITFFFFRLHLRCLHRRHPGFWVRRRESV